MQAIISGSIQKTPYEQAQAFIGQPAQETPQLEVSMSQLREAVEQHGETLRALLRRLEPVSAASPASMVPFGAGIGDSPAAARAPVACFIDHKREEIEALTREVQQAIRELQV